MLKSFFLPIGLTPPATPPHQMWKPIAPVALLGKNRKSELPKPTPNKVIQIEARPLPLNKMRSKPQTTTTTGQTQPFSLDHDYCLPPKEPNQNEVGHRWNVKQQPSIIIKTVLSSNKPVQQSVPKVTSTPSVTEETQKTFSNSQPVNRRDERDELNSSVLETPDASPNRPESESPLLDEAKDNQSKPLGYSESTPKQYQDRGRSRRRYRSRSSSSSKSSSSSSSRSRSPPRKRSVLMFSLACKLYCCGYTYLTCDLCYRYRSRHSNSRSSSSSLSRSRSSSRSYSPPRRRRYSYSSSRSGSWSRSRSRSRSRSSDSHGHQHWRSHGR